MNDEDEFLRDLAAVLNKHSIDNECNTPDFILAGYVVMCLAGYSLAVEETAKWKGDTE